VTDESGKIPSQVPVFPLPDSVLFPRQVLPLHIFEPRYCKMTEDALAADSVIAIALLRPGYEEHYFSAAAPIHRLIGVGRIVGSERMKDGKFNILLRGESRAVIMQELPARPYRMAEIDPVCGNGSLGDTEQLALREELRICVNSAFSDCQTVRGQIEQLMVAPLQLGELVDLLAAGLPTPGEVRQVLFEELNPAARLKLLIDNIRTVAAVHRRRRTHGSGGCHLN